MMRVIIIDNCWYNKIKYDVRKSEREIGEILTDYHVPT